MQTDWTKVLGSPGYRVYDYQIDEPRRHLTLHLRRKRGNRKLTCAQCGAGAGHPRLYERKVRDLPCFGSTSVVVELSDPLSQLWCQGGAQPAGAQQGALQQALRRCRGGGL